MKILIHPNKFLTGQAKPVEVFDGKLLFLIEKMFVTMYQHKGVGLAANQVGVLKQVVIINLGWRPIVLINPTVKETDGECTNHYEGCLSIPNFTASVERDNRIFIESSNRYGGEQNFEADGYLAKVVQHECDHLRGVLINGK